VKVLEETIRHRSEQQRKSGPGVDATCQLCLKTKFADGVGHVCAYCGVRCCARCGGKVTLRSNKVIWVCILCRKKQELLIKTGQWMTQPFSSSMPEKENRGPDSGSSHYHQHYRHPPPLQRTSSLQHQGRELPVPQLRRQYSQENRPMIPMDPRMPPRRSTSSDAPDYYSPHYRDFDLDYGPPPPPAPTHPPHHHQSSYTSSGAVPHSSTLGLGPPPAKPPPVDWSYDNPNPPPPPTQGSPRLAHHYYPVAHSSSQQRMPPQQQHTLPGHPSRSALMGTPAGLGQRSLSSSEEELRSTPDYTSGDELESRLHHQHRRQQQHGPPGQHMPPMPMQVQGSFSSVSSNKYIMPHQHHPGPGRVGISMGGTTTGFATSVDSSGLVRSGSSRAMVHSSYDSGGAISSKSNSGAMVLGPTGGGGPSGLSEFHHRYHQSNNNANVSSTAGIMSPGAERIRIGPRSGSAPGGSGPVPASSTVVPVSGVVGASLSGAGSYDRDRSRQKKTVRFDSDEFGGDASSVVVAPSEEDQWYGWDQSSSERQGSQDSTTKDSGIDTGSNFTSSEDSNRELVHTKVF